MTTETLLRCTSPTALGTFCDATLFAPVYELPDPPVFGQALRTVQYRCIVCGARYLAVEPTMAARLETGTVGRARWVRV